MKIKSFTEVPEALAGYGPLQNEDGTVFYEASVRSVNKDVVIARLKGVEDRNASEALARAKTRLYVDRALLGEVEDGRFFIADLRGARALDKEGRELARVLDVLNYGAGDMLALKGEKGEFMLPFKPPFADKIDVTAGTLEIFIPDGWLEKAEKEEA